MDTIQTMRLPLIVCAATGCALTAGIFFAFSTFVMQALAMQPPGPGISAMQSINITVINPWFMTAFFGPAVARRLQVNHESSVSDRYLGNAPTNQLGISHAETR